MDLPKIREAAANIDRAYKAAQSAKLAKDELDLTFPDETARRQELGGMLADQAGAAKRWLVKAQADLQAAEDELQEKWAEGSRARRGEGEFRVPLASRPSSRSSEQMLDEARAILYVPGDEDGQWTPYTADQVGRVLDVPTGHSPADRYVRRMLDIWSSEELSAADKVEDMAAELNAYDAQRKSGRPKPIDTGGRELLAVLDPRTRPPLRLVEPDADAELEAIDRELDELAGGSTAAAEVVAAQRRAAKHEAHRVYDHNPDRLKLQWLQLRRGLYSARSLTNASYQARGPKGGAGPWHATHGETWLDRDGNEVGRPSNMVHSGVAQAAAQKHYDRARVTAEFTTDDSGEIAGPQYLTPAEATAAIGGPSEELARIHSAQEREAQLTREHGDKLRGEATGKARPKPEDYSAATHAATEKAAALQRSVQRMHTRVEKAATKAAQKKAGAGLDNAKAKLKRARAKLDELARADAVAWAVAEYDRRVDRTPVQRGWDASATIISEEILPTPHGVKVSNGYWVIPYDGDLPAPPVYPGLPVTQPIGAHNAAGVIVEVNKNRSRISVRLYGHRKTEKYSWRKGRGRYIKVGDSGGSGLQLGRAVEYMDPGV